MADWARPDQEEEQEQEQEQEHLLGEWDGSCDGEKSQSLHARNSRRWYQTRIARVIMLAVTAFTVLAFAGYILVVKRIIQDWGIEYITRNDYILDPAWDTHEAPRVRSYHFEIRDTIYHPDGVYRPMLLVNQQFPGPLIEANEGDVIQVKVDNHATNATSIHWHGIYQRGSPFMDGTVGITQCPIAPNLSQTYVFNVTGQSGSYWWHAHQGVQSSDGVHGPLIIHSRNESLQQINYQTDRVLLLSDHYWNSSSELLWDYLSPDKENDEPIPVGALINGRSKYRDCEEISKRYPGRKCWTPARGIYKASNALALWLAKFHPHYAYALAAMPDYPGIDLEPEKSHRLRLINVGAFADFHFQIDEHELAVTEVDGTDVLPYTTQRVSINPAQRYSVIVNANSTRSKVFWLRARMDTHCFVSSKGIQTDALAVVRYQPAVGRSDTNNNWQTYSDMANDISSEDWDSPLPNDCKDMNTTNVLPVIIDPPPQHEDSFFYVHSSIKIGDWQLARAMFNESSFRPDFTSPTIDRAWAGLRSDNDSWNRPNQELQSAFINDEAFDASRELVIQTRQSATVDILISNFDDGTHPLHLHGYKFWILAQGHGYPPRKDELSGITRENVQPLYDQLDLRNPLRRDTASVEGYGWILIRVKADNPGAWALHCHVSWHAEAGLVMQLLSNTEELKHFEPWWKVSRLCAAKGIEKGVGPPDEYFVPHGPPS
ncbi:hypothetical protein AC578_4190 [Pseudocercospora eumusae]|uniref:Multicopper oxidase n=1 Tax=Pseudocercospora eumusae TaxID=321146 RepID=A0A139HJ52_9PEZI|nr:hypothetical protein AC578_4190 [Pseudocercospora eumusae]